MDEKTVELRKVGVRGTSPLCLKWSEFVAVLFTFLDNRPGELTKNYIYFPEKMAPPFGSAIFCSAGRDRTCDQPVTF